MLKELNEAFGAACSTVATTAQALNDGSKILRIKGAAAKQLSAIQSILAIEEAKKKCNEQQLNAAAELLNMIED